MSMGQISGRYYYKAQVCQIVINIRFGKLKLAFRKKVVAKTNIFLKACRYHQSILKSWPAFSRTANLTIIPICTHFR